MKTHSIRHHATQATATAAVILGSHHHRLRRLGFAALLAALVAVLGAGACSKSSSPTAPYGGGGGGTPPAFNLGPFAIGQSLNLSFATAGTFGYHCIPHQSMGMTGTVQVDAGGADSVVVQIAASGLTFTPSTAHLKPGGHVRWVNASASAVHTVTSD